MTLINTAKQLLRRLLFYEQDGCQSFLSSTRLKDKAKGPSLRPITTINCFILSIKMALDADRETATNAHDINVQQQEQRKPRHRSRPTRSPSLSRSSTNSSSKRSHSPVITFHPAPLSPDNTKGVKNITRKVIRRLEGLGHLEMVDMNLTVSEEDDEHEKWRRKGAVEGGEESEVEKVLYALGRDAVKSSQSKETRIANGTTEHKSPKSKTDFEIPRKVLHSSIGPSMLSLDFDIIFQLTFSLKASSPYIFIYRRAMCAPLFSCYGWHWLPSYQLTFYGSDHQSLKVCTNVTQDSSCEKVKR